MDIVRASRRRFAAPQHEEVSALVILAILEAKGRAPHPEMRACEPLRMRAISAMIASLTIFLLTPTLAQACSCMRIAPDGYRQQAAVIIEGKVLGIKREGDINGRVITRIAVSKLVKGEAPKTVTVSTRGNSAACGVSFTKGQTGEFLLSRDNGKLSTNSCLMIGARR
jgi:hypothetical protein